MSRLYVLVAREDSSPLLYFNSKLSKEKIEKIERVSQIIYGVIDDFKTEIFASLIKKGKYPHTYYDHELIDEIKLFDDKKIIKFDKQNNIISPFTDKTFKRLSKRNLPNEVIF